MHNAFYYDGDYFLVPEGYPDAEAFQAAMAARELPCTVQLIPLFENSQEFIHRCKAWNGLSMTPYFISDYLLEPMDFTIGDADDIHPTTVTLLTQKEYNARLRALVVGYCPGCTRFGGVTDKDSSLEGHHTEISLDGVCLYRHTEGEPDCTFLDNLPTRWPSALLNGSADDILAMFSKKLGLHYQSGLLRIQTDGTRELLLRQDEADLFLTGVTSILNAILQREFKGRFTMRLTNPAPTDEATLRSLVEQGQETLRTSSLVYATVLGYLDFVPGTADALLPFLEQAAYFGFLTTLCVTDSRIYLLFADPAECQVFLRYHSPALTKCDARLTLCRPDGPETRRISFQMEQL